jgi:hypothetical protein
MISGSSGTKNANEDLGGTFAILISLVKRRGRFDIL